MIPKVFFIGPVRSDRANWWRSDELSALQEQFGDFLLVDFSTMIMGIFCKVAKCRVWFQTNVSWIVRLAEYAVDELWFDMVSEVQYDVVPLS